MQQNFLEEKKGQNILELVSISRVSSIVGRGAPKLHSLVLGLS